MIRIFRLNSQHINWKNLYDHLMNTIIFTLIMNKIFIWAPEIVSKTKSIILMDETSRWCPTWQQVNDILWAIGYCIRPIKKSWVSRKTRGCGNQFNWHGILLVLYFHGKPKHVLQSQNMIHFHFTLSLRAHQYVNLDFYIPWYNLWKIFKGP